MPHTHQNLRSNFVIKKVPKKMRRKQPLNLASISPFDMYILEGKEGHVSERPSRDHTLFTKVVETFKLGSARIDRWIKIRINLWRDEWIASQTREQDSAKSQTPAQVPL